MAANATLLLPVRDCLSVRLGLSGFVPDGSWLEAFSTMQTTWVTVIQSRYEFYYCIVKLNFSIILLR